MAITFNEVSLGRTPFISIEMDNSGAIPNIGKDFKALVIGQRLSGSPSVANVIVQVSSKQDAINRFGAGSQLAMMFDAWFANNVTTEVYAGVLDEASAGTARVQTITFTGPATASGTLNLYLNGTQVSVPVTASMTAVQVATAVLAKISAIANTLPFTVSQGANPNDHVLTVTSRWKGESGNDDDIRVNYYSTDSTPVGIGVTIEQTVAGATNPDVANIIAAMGDDQYHVIASPYTDTSSVTALKEEMERRWSASVQKTGVLFMAKDDTQVNLSSWGNGLNSQCLSTIGHNGSPTPSYKWAAAVAAVVASSASLDPARPYTNLKLNGILAPAKANRFTLLETNALLYDGISTYNTDNNGYVYMGRQITMYQTNAEGQADASYLDVPVIMTLARLRQDVKDRLGSKYSRHKLANDGTKFSSDQAIVTPNIIKGEMISLCREWEYNGLVENTAAFKESLIVERNAGDVNRIDIQLRPDIINMFLVAGVKISFIL